MLPLIYKTLGAEALDRFYSGNPLPLADAYARGEQLRQNNPKPSAASQELEKTKEIPADSGKAFDLHFKNGEQVIRLGYDQAITLASKQNPPKPLETFLVANVTSNYQVHICEGQHAVMVFLFVPDTRTYGSKRATSKSWVVHAGGVGDRATEQLGAVDAAIAKTRVSGE
jgi:hypothetical protein